MSKVWLPKDGDYTTMLDFFVQKFPQIDECTWRDRINRGLVHDLNNLPIHINSPYLGDQHICYYREVPDEKTIPVTEKILFENDNFLVIDKPHFLPIHPSGAYLKETLVFRLREKLNLPEIAPVHRIDRLTAGLVILTKKRELRKHYQGLFENRLIKKTYLAVSQSPTPKQNEWQINNHLAEGEKWFLMDIDLKKSPNSSSYIKHLKSNSLLHLFQISPLSGKKHQIRVHLSSIGHPILNDPLYPDFSEKPPDDYNKPMQLLAQGLQFTDPISKESFDFKSQLKLILT